jgi:hypothetical protein
MEQAAADARQAGVHGTPSFVLVTPSGQRLFNVSGLDSGTFCRELAAALA